MPLAELISGSRAELLARRRRLWARHCEGRDAVQRSQHLLAHISRLDLPAQVRHRQAARYQLMRQAEGIVLADRARQQLAETPSPYELQWVTS